MKVPKNITVYASGTGSNFIAIYNQIKNGNINGKITLLISDNPNAKAINFAKKIDIFQDIMI